MAHTFIITVQGALIEGLVIQALLLGYGTVPCSLDPKLNNLCVQLNRTVPYRTLYNTSPGVWPEFTVLYLVPYRNEGGYGIIMEYGPRYGTVPT